MIWTAGFRTAVISPYEQIQLTEPRGFADQTVRQVLHMAGGGERLRVRLTNRYGRTPLTIAAAMPATEHGQAALTLDGAEKLTIPPGEEAAGDPMDLPVAPGADLFLSLYFPEETGLATYSHRPMETPHIVGGNHVTSPALPEAEQVEARFYVSGVDVLTPDDTAIAVAFGDSGSKGSAPRPARTTAPWTSSTGASSGDGSSTWAPPETAYCGTRSASTRWRASTATFSRFPA